MGAATTPFIRARGRDEVAEETEPCCAARVAMHWRRAVRFRIAAGTREVSLSSEDLGGDEDVLGGDGEEDALVEGERGRPLRSDGEGEGGG